MRRERCLAASETFVNYGIWCCVQCNKSKREFFFCLLLTLIGKSQFVGKMSGCGHKHPAKAFSSSIRRRRHSDKHVLELNRGQPDLIPHLDMSMPMPPITPPAAFLLPSLNRSTVKAPSSRASSSKGKGESQRFTLDGMASTDLVEVTFVASIVACVENQNNKDTSSCSWSSKIFYSIDVGIHDNYNTKTKGEYILRNAVYCPQALVIIGWDSIRCQVQWFTRIPRQKNKTEYLSLWNLMHLYFSTIRSKCESNGPSLNVLFLLLIAGLVNIVQMNCCVRRAMWSRHSKHAFW